MVNKEENSKSRKKEGIRNQQHSTDLTGLLLRQQQEEWRGGMEMKNNITSSSQCLLHPFRFLSPSPRASHPIQFPFHPVPPVYTNISCRVTAFKSDVFQSE